MCCRVYRPNATNGELEFCLAKSFDVRRIETHDGGFAGWQADAFREATALRHVAGTAGVAELWDVITLPDGSIHLIMGYAPVWRHLPCSDVDKLLTIIFAWGVCAYVDWLSLCKGRNAWTEVLAGPIDQYYILLELGFQV